MDDLWAASFAFLRMGVRALDHPPLAITYRTGSRPANTRPTRSFHHAVGREGPITNVELGRKLAYPRPSSTGAKNRWSLTRELFGS